MVTIWKSARRQALLQDPSDAQLGEYLECFTAGYNRGVEDVRKTVRRKVWTLLTDRISDQLARNRSVIEAGCWLAGMYYGREDAIAEVHKDPGRLILRFGAGWESGFIADCALECDPSAAKLSRVFSLIFLRRTTPSINDRLARESLPHQATTWEQANAESEELVLLASRPAQHTQGGSK